MAAKRMQLDLATIELEAAVQREAELAQGEWGGRERGWGGKLAHRGALTSLPPLFSPATTTTAARIRTLTAAAAAATAAADCARAASAADAADAARLAAGMAALTAAAVEAEGKLNAIR